LCNNDDNAQIKIATENVIRHLIFNRKPVKPVIILPAGISSIGASRLALTPAFRTEIGDSSLRLAISVRRRIPACLGSRRGIEFEKELGLIEVLVSDKEGLGILGFVENFLVGFL
jgi:hypothetical protein